MTVMSRTTPALAFVLVCGLAVYAAMQAPQVMPPRAFADPSPLPFQAPQFDRIKDGDFAPALAEGMRRQRAEIDAIAASKAAPSLENTVVAMERSGQMLTRASYVFYHLAQANTNDTLQKV